MCGREGPRSFVSLSQSAGRGAGSQVTGTGGGRAAPLLIQRVLRPRQRITETPCTQRSVAGPGEDSSAQAEQPEALRQHSATPPAARQCGQAGGGVGQQQQVWARCAALEQPQAPPWQEALPALRAWAGNGKPMVAAR